MIIVIIITHVECCVFQLLQQTIQWDLERMRKTAAERKAKVKEQHEY